MRDYLDFGELTTRLRKCEAENCENEFLEGYGYSLAVCWLVTGHAHVKSFMCDDAPGNQHWGCSPEHALEVAMKCATEHMLPKLYDKHFNTDKPRVSPYEKHLHDDTDPNFHIITDYPKFLSNAYVKHYQHVNTIIERKRNNEHQN